MPTFIHNARWMKNAGRIIVIILSLAQLSISSALFAKEDSKTNPLQGIISLTATERAKLILLYQEGKEAQKLIKSILHKAEDALTEDPQPIENITTSGQAVKTGIKADTAQAAEQAGNVYELALAYAVSDDQKYLNHAQLYLTQWASVNIPTGDAVASTALFPLVRGYDLLRPSLPDTERARIDLWLQRVAEQLISMQEQARKDQAQTGYNNHRSHALLMITSIGCAINNANLIQYGVSNFLPHIEHNLHIIEGEPEGFGLDYHERNAVHYVAFNLKALMPLAVILDRLRNVPGNPYNISYNPYLSPSSTLSIEHTFQALLPYAAGEATSDQEFAKSLNPNDQKRLNAGALHTTFQRKYALPALEAASYFTTNVKGTKTSYSLPVLAADIIQQDKGKAPPSTAYPTIEFLLNDIRSQRENGKAGKERLFKPILLPSATISK